MTGPVLQLHIEIPALFAQSNPFYLATLVVTPPSLQDESKWLRNTPSLMSIPKGRVPKKKSRKGVVFCQTGGGGGVLVKSQTSFLDKYFFSEHGESF